MHRVEGGSRKGLNWGAARNVSTAATHRNEAVADDATSSTLDVWYDFLRLLHEQGDFEDKSTSCELLVQQHDDVKEAIVSFARRRPDAIFSLPPLEVAAVAEAELLSRDLPDRKLRNADRRLKYTFVSGRFKAPGGHGSVESGHFHATTQDLMRVLRDWMVVPQATVDAAAPGLTQALQHLLRCVRQLAVSEPDPAALERAKRLGTPTAVELEERWAAREQVEERLKAKEAKEAAFLERRHRLRIRDAVEGGAVLEAGDWFCASCGALNWKDRPRCFRCAAPSDKSGNSVVTAQDVAEVYGSRPPRRRARAVTAAADADAMYEAQAAAAAVAAESPAAARSAGGRGKGGSARASGRRAPLLLGADDEDDDVDDSRAGGVPRSPGAYGRGAVPSAQPRSRAGRPQGRMEDGPRGRPGLRRRIPEGGEEDELDLDDDEGGPYTSEARASPAYQRSIREYYEGGEREDRGPGGRAARGRENHRGDGDLDERGRGGRDPGVNRQKAGGWRASRPANRDLGDLEFEDWEASSVPASREYRGSRGQRRGSGGGGGDRGAEGRSRGSYAEDEEGEDFRVDGGDRGRGRQRSGGAVAERRLPAGGDRGGRAQRSGRVGWLDEEDEADDGRDSAAATERGRRGKR